MISQVAQTCKPERNEEEQEKSDGARLVEERVARHGVRAPAAAAVAAAAAREIARDYVRERADRRDGRGAEAERGIEQRYPILKPTGCLSNSEAVLEKRSRKCDAVDGCCSRPSRSGVQG